MNKEVNIDETLNQTNIRSFGNRRSNMAFDRNASSSLETTEMKLPISNVQSWLEMVTDGVWEWDFKANRQYLSPQFWKLLGYENKDLCDQNNAWQEIVHPEDLALFLRAIQQHLYDNEILNIPVRYLHKDDGIIWVLCRGVAQRDSAGTYVRMLGTYTDITEVKFSQNAAVARSQVLSQIAGGASLQIVLDSLVRGVELQYHGIFCSILLLDSTKTKLKLGSAPTLPDFYNTAIDGLVIGPVVGSCGSAAYSGKRVIVTDIQNDERWVLFRSLAKQANLGSCWSEPIISSKGAVLGTFAMYHSRAHTPSALDIGVITEAAQLAAIAIERKADEEERSKIELQLLQTKRLESIGALAAGIAHDFNNFLTSLFGFIELAQIYMRQGSFKKAALSLENATKALDRSKSLSNQLLTFSQGGTPLKRICQISDLIKETCSFALSGSNVNYKINIMEELWLCNIDRHQIAQVIDNIVRNSREALANGGDITITAENYKVLNDFPGLLAAGDYLKITISDDGQGIPVDMMDKVFELFFSTKEVGRGLGLSIAYSIIKKHAGHIQVKSKYGSGASFEVYLPAITDPSITESILPVQDNVIEAAKVHAKILVMDDEESIRALVSNILEALGYSYELAESGEVAISLYRKALNESRPFDLVILDLTVRGGLGGEETIKALLQIDPKVKALVSSGYANNPIAVEPTLHGFLGSVPKPYSIANIARAIDRSLRG